jgi:hypothetical protein
MAQTLYAHMKKKKRKAIDWKEIFENHISSKKLASRIHNGLLELNHKKTHSDLENGKKKKSMNISSQRVNRYELIWFNFYNIFEMTNLKNEEQVSGY